jgi:hypothetical protein
VLRCWKKRPSTEKTIYPPLVDGTWKLRAEPWIALGGPRKGHLEAITLWATRKEHTPGLFLENNGQFQAFFYHFLHPQAAIGVLSALTQNQQIDLPGDFTTTQLLALGFEI